MSISDLDQSNDYTIYATGMYFTNSPVVGNVIVCANATGAFSWASIAGSASGATGALAVQSVTAGDASIIIGGTQAYPTVRASGVFGTTALSNGFGGSAKFNGTTFALTDSSNSTTWGGTGTTINGAGTSGKVSFSAFSLGNGANATVNVTCPNVVAGQCILLTVDSSQIVPSGVKIYAVLNGITAGVGFSMIIYNIDAVSVTSSILTINYATL